MRICYAISIDESNQVRHAPCQIHGRSVAVNGLGQASRVKSSWRRQRDRQSIQPKILLKPLPIEQSAVTFLFSIVRSAVLQFYLVGTWDQREASLKSGSGSLSEVNSSKEAFSRSMQAPHLWVR